MRQTHVRHHSRLNSVTNVPGYLENLINFGNNIIQNRILVSSSMLRFHQDKLIKANKLFEIQLLQECSNYESIIQIFRNLAARMFEDLLCYERVKRQKRYDFASRNVNLRSLYEMY